MQLVLLTDKLDSGLRDHLLAAQAQHTGDLHPSPPHNHSNGAQNSDALESQMTQTYGSSPVTPGMEPQNPEVRKGRRELSTSKRAAQNRAAQVNAPNSDHFVDD
jgi:hypothetical protein